MNFYQIGFIIGLLSTITVVIALFLLLQNRNKFKNMYQAIYDRYKDVMDLEAYKENVISKTNEIINGRDKEIASLDAHITTLKNSYSEKYSYFEKLLHEISLYEEKDDVFSYGIYEPHFDFGTSEKYKEAILTVREKQKVCIKNNAAAICTTEWTVGGSKSEGTRMTKRYMKLMLRAFNGECEGMISDVRWNNISKMEERLQKSFDAINKMGETHYISITDFYKDLKLEELQLSFEYQEKLHEEKEEQRLIKEQMREEEKLQREIERKNKEIENQIKAEAELQKKLKEAYEQGKKSEAEKFEEQIRELNQQIENDKRAVSQAQLTRTGHVYIISNIGSFGENIYKIGMTRRLEPKDRIDELGSASVPFEFDVHALIKSDNAPALENSLHKYFDSRRVNLVNARKEFFYLTLEEIENYAKDNNIDVEFTRLAEAKEFRKSMAIREAHDKNRTDENVIPDIVPNSI